MPLLAVWADSWLVARGETGGGCSGFDICLQELARLGAGTGGVRVMSFFCSNLGLDPADLEPCVTSVSICGLVSSTMERLVAVLLFEGTGGGRPGGVVILSLRGASGEREELVLGLGMGLGPGGDSSLDMVEGVMGVGRSGGVEDARTLGMFQGTRDSESETYISNEEAVALACSLPVGCGRGPSRTSGLYVAMGRRGAGIVEFVMSRSSREDTAVLGERGESNQRSWG